METFDCIVSRRSIRSYSDEMVNSNDLNKILEAASYAPSGMNNQKWQFTAIQNNEIINKLNETMKQEILKIPMDENANQLMKFLNKKANDENGNFFYDAKTIVIVSNDKNNPTASADSALAMGNMMLMANDLGLGSVWLNQLNYIGNWPEILKYLNSIGIPEDHVVYGTLAIGYGKGESLKPLERKAKIKIIS